MPDRVVFLEGFPDERIAVLTFDRPPLNAIDEQVVTELAEATADPAAHKEIRAVLVGGGRAPTSRPTRRAAPCSCAARSTASSWPARTSTSSIGSPRKESSGRCSHR